MFCSLNASLKCDILWKSNLLLSPIDTEINRTRCKARHGSMKCEKFINTPAHLSCSDELLWSVTVSPSMWRTWKRTKRFRHRMKLLHHLFVSSINKSCQFHKPLSGISKSKWPLVYYVSAIMFYKKKKEETCGMVKENMSTLEASRMLKNLPTVDDNQCSLKITFCDPSSMRHSEINSLWIVGSQIFA